MMRYNQANYIARLNELQAMQAQVAMYEKSTDYRKTVKVFERYIDTVRKFNDPKSLINTYIRFAQYCELMEDRLLATDLYRDALDLEIQWGIDAKHQNRLQIKIQDLAWF